MDDANDHQPDRREADRPAPLPADDLPDPLPPAEPAPEEGLMARLGPAAWLGIAWASLPAVLGLTIFVRYRGVVADWLKSNEDVGPALYLAAFAITAGLGLLPTWAQAVIGGYAFGLWVGFALALIGFTGASVIGFFTARSIAGDRVEKEIERHPKAKVVRDTLVDSGPMKTLWLVILVRFPPNSPFAVMNLLLSSVRVPFGTYLAGTVIGMAPRTLAYAYIGTTISSFDEVSQPKWLVYGGIGVSLLILFVLSHIGNKAIERATRQGEITPEPAEAPNDADDRAA